MLSQAGTRGDHSPWLSSSVMTRAVWCGEERRARKSLAAAAGQRSGMGGRAARRDQVAGWMGNPVRALAAATRSRRAGSVRLGLRDSETLPPASTTSMSRGRRRSGFRLVGVVGRRRFRAVVSPLVRASSIARAASAIARESAYRSRNPRSMAISAANSGSRTSRGRQACWWSMVRVSSRRVRWSVRSGASHRFPNARAVRSS